MTRKRDVQDREPPVSADFVFGTLATDALRIAQLRAAATGLRHAHDLEPADPVPGVPITVRATVGGGVRADHVTCYWSADGEDPAGDRGQPTRGHAVELVTVAVRWDTLAWSYVETWAGEIPPQPDGALVRYRLQGWTDDGTSSTWATEAAGVVAGDAPAGANASDALRLTPDAPPLWPVPRTGPFAVHVDREHVPEWLRDAVIYQVFVDRFATTGGRPFAQPPTPAGFYGGTLRGVLERLDHIEALGATCIWLSPIFPSPSHHGYDATDLTSVEPRLGTLDDLRALVEAAHARGMRVILDFAANHVSSGHPAFQAAVADPDAPEVRWFTFTRWPDQYLSFFGVLDHPQLDADDPGAQAHLIEAASLWLGLGVDGFRCDYANGPSHAFWSAFRAATRDVRADSVTIGEVVETPALQRTYVGRLDGCLDFVLMQALRRCFASGEITPAEFDSFVRRHLAFMGDDLVLPSFLDNHDMNRFLWVVRGDVRRLRLAALCQFTLPHPPIIYYGTEVGLSQARDVRDAEGNGHPEESRLPMSWDGVDDGLLAFYRELVAMRRGRAEAWRHTRTTLVADDEGLYVYRCGGRDGVVVALNNGASTVAWASGRDTGLRVLLATGPGVTLDGDRLILPPFEGAVLAGVDHVDS